MSLVKVRYRGIADERTITKKDFESAGVKVENDVTWNRRNNFAVVMDLSETAEELLRAQGHFRLEKVTDGGDNVVISEATDITSEGNTLVDGDTGAQTEAKKTVGKVDVPTGGTTPSGNTGRGSSTAGA